MPGKSLKHRRKSKRTFQVSPVGLERIQGLKLQHNIGSETESIPLLARLFFSTATVSATAMGLLVFSFCVAFLSDFPLSLIRQLESLPPGANQWMATGFLGMMVLSWLVATSFSLYATAKVSDHDPVYIQYHMGCWAMLSIVLLAHLGFRSFLH